MSYGEWYHRSITEKEGFWSEQASKIDWFKAPKQILSKNEKGFYRWFADGEMNTAHLCLDVHVKNGLGSKNALIYHSAVTNRIEYFTYNDLLDQVSRFAAGLQVLGIQKGDTVVIYMPMIPQAVIAMLACARLGAIHSVVFGGFAPHELAMRIDDAKPNAIITASHGIEIDKRIDYLPLVAKAMQEATHKLDHVISFQREEGGDLPESMLDFMKVMDTQEKAACVPVLSGDPLYILYTSGTTGKPKGIVRDNGGHAVAMKFSMRYIYDAKQEDVFWAASDVGWVVGHSYIVYGPLIKGCTTILYEGKPVRTPDAGAFWKVVDAHKVNIMFTAPTAIRAIRKEDPEGTFFNSYDLSSLRALFLAGERCDPSTYEWIGEHLNVPVIDHWWQTESGWPMLGIMQGIEQLSPKSGSAGMPICGFDIRILSEDGARQSPYKEGNVAIKLPMPPGCLMTLWKNDERFVKGYFEHYPGYYLTGDGGYRDDDGFFYIMGRVDDVINVAGHRLSTGEMEELVASNKAVAECAVVGVADELRGQVPVALVVLKDGATIAAAQLESDLVALIREKIGAVSYFKKAIVVKRLPKTRSGKILRKLIRQIADKEDFVVPSTIDDPAIIDELRGLF